GSVWVAGREFAGSLRTGPARTPAIVWLGIVVVLLLGTRGLLLGHIPGFGDFPEFPNRPWTLFTQWFSGFRNAGLGSEAPAPTAYALLGSAGIVFLGAMSVLRRVLLVGLLPVGIAGAWRMGSESSSTR